MAINSDNGNNINNNHNNMVNNEIYSYSNHRVSTKSYVYVQSKPKPPTENYSKKKKTIIKKMIAVVCVLAVLVGAVITVSIYSVPVKDRKSVV